jgi:hypothetical protein
MSVCSVSARTVQARPSARQGMLMWWCLVAFLRLFAASSQVWLEGRKRGLEKSRLRLTSPGAHPWL